MKSEFILDSSMLLMAIYQENKDIFVNDYFKSAVMHHVNISEIMNVLICDGMPKNHAIEVIQKLIPKIIGTNSEEVYLAAQIIPSPRLNYDFWILGRRWASVSITLRKPETR